MSSQILVGMMTAPSRAVAEAIADRLVQEGLIACANIAADVTSIYRWQGAVERASEILVIMKTTDGQAGRVVRRVRELHPYDVPEVLFLPVATGNHAYLSWVQESVAAPLDTKDDAEKQ
jgi:periplasmic divalent cation tolerance protein